MKISAHVMTCWLAFFKDNRDNRDNFLHERKMWGTVGRDFRLIFQLKNCPYCLYCLLKKRRRKAWETVPVVFINRWENDGDYTF